MLGDQRDTVQNGLARATGLDAGSIGQLLEIAAPLVRGALGQQQRQQDLDANGLSDLLGQQQQAAQDANPDLMGIIGNLLDMNNDGSALDDILHLAGKLFRANR
jgi:hypothetical protein